MINNIAKYIRETFYVYIYLWYIHVCNSVIIQRLLSFKPLGANRTQIWFFPSVTSFMNLNYNKSMSVESDIIYIVQCINLNWTSKIILPQQHIFSYLAFIFVTEHFITERAFNIFDLQMGRIDMASQMICLHETNAALRTKMWPVIDKQIYIFIRKL